MKLIVGLGNPGIEYKFTRHNFGSFIIEALAQELGANFKRSIFAKSRIAKAIYHDEEILLLLPLTFMNLSGRAVNYILRKYKIALNDILVVCDDTNLDFGKIRIKPAGSDGGHNGLKSIISSLQSREFARLRIGIGSAGKDLAKYVLEDFSKEEKKELKSYAESAVKACLLWIKSGIEEAMNKFN